MTRQAANAIDRRAWTVTRTRAATGAWNANGDWVPGTATPVTIKAVVQPASGNQLMDVPEGIRTEAGWIAWSRSDLLIDDKIANNGVSYRVLFVWPRDQDGDFYRAALGRLG